MADENGKADAILLARCSEAFVSNIKAPDSDRGFGFYGKPRNFIASNLYCF
jgi:hypothetical protein